MRYRTSILALLAAAAALSSCGHETDEPAPAPTTASALPPPPAAFFQCMSCHSLEPGRNGIGPSLHGLFGSKAGAAPGYPFSPALGASGITWDRATLEQWLAGPGRLVPGTRMMVSVPDPVRRKDVIDYLQSLP